MLLKFLTSNLFNEGQTEDANACKRREGVHSKVAGCVTTYYTEVCTKSPRKEEFISKKESDDSGP